MSQGFRPGRDPYDEPPRRPRSSLHALRDSELCELVALGPDANVRARRVLARRTLNMLENMPRRRMLDADARIRYRQTLRFLYEMSRRGSVQK